jgi:flagellar motor protein MotB
MAEEHGHGDAEHAEHGGGHGGGGHGGGHGGGGHGGGEHEESGAPEWLISFADNVALMMGFFVILLAMNMGPKGSGTSQAENPHDSASAADMLDFVIAVREAFNNKVDINSKDPADAPLIRRMLQRTSGKVREDGPQGEQDKLQSIRPTDYEQVTAAVEFDDRQALLSSAARNTLVEVARKIRDQHWVIEVRGHISPFESMRNPVKGMELSHQRAAAAAVALVEGGVKWENLRLVACGDNARVVSRTFDRQEDRANQRVEIVVTNQTIGPDPNAQPGESAAAPE